MDIPTLTLAKAYTDSQRLAYEDANTISWDSSKSTDGLTTITDGQSTFIKISDLHPTITEIMGGTAIVSTDETDPEKNLITTDIIFDMSQIGLAAYQVQGYGFFVVLEANENFGITKPGFYYAKEFYGNFNSWSFSISWGAVHPIDPKYLPGAVLPVIELPFELLEPIILEGGNVELPGEVVAKLEAAVSQVTPIIVKLTQEDIGIALVANIVMTSDTDNGLAYTAKNEAGNDSFVLVIGRINNKWNAIV